MPPKIIFWTGTWKPFVEAHSIEIGHLRTALQRKSWVVSLSTQSLSISPRAGVIQLPISLWWVYRSLQIGIEQLADIMHAFGPFDSWHLIRSFRTRRVLFTVTIPGKPADFSPFDKVAMFAVESEALRALLLSNGIISDRVRLIYPGVDLNVFSPQSFPPERPFRVLFASSPTSIDEYEDRGLPLLIALARRLPDIEIWCPWRNLDNGHAKQPLFSNLLLPKNFVIWQENVPDMSTMYRQVHATIIPFGPGFGKSCPNSCIEGLACGRPSLVSEHCGIADLVHRSGAGIKFEWSVHALEAAVCQLTTSLEHYSLRARGLAEATFGIRHFRESYRELYFELANNALI